MRVRAIIVCASFGAACSFGSLTGLSGGDDEPPPNEAPEAAPDVAPFVVDAGLEDVDAASRPQLYRNAVMANNPIAYYRFEDQAATAKDETSTHDATWGGEPTFDAEGVFPGTSGVLFAKAKVARLAVPGTVMRFAGNAPFTLEAWLRPGTLRDYQWLASTENPRAGWSILGTADGKVQYEVWDVADGGKISLRYFAPTARKLILSVYQHVVVAYDGTRAYLWIDGVRVKDDAWPNAAPDVGSLVVGCRQDGDGGWYECLEDWFLDELAIYGHALGDQDVALHYAIVRQGL
jgi:hypothetical protein